MDKMSEKDEQNAESSIVQTRSVDIFIQPFSLIYFNFWVSLH